MISTQNISNFEPVEKRSRFMKSVGYLDFDEFFVEVGVDPNRVFLLTNGMWYDLSIIVNEIVLSNKFSFFSFEPQHYLKDSYIPIFALIYTLKLFELQLLKCRLANRFCLWHSSLLKLLKVSYRPFWWHTMFIIISSEVCLASATWLGSNALKRWPCRSPPSPRESCALRSAHLCNRLFSWNCDTTLL